MYAGSRIWTSENTPYAKYVNKGKKRTDWSYGAPVRLMLDITRAYLPLAAHNRVLGAVLIVGGHEAPSPTTLDSRGVRLRFGAVGIC